MATVPALRMIPRERGAGAGRPAGVAPDVSAAAAAEEISPHPGARFREAGGATEPGRPRRHTPYEQTLRSAQIARTTADRWQRVAQVPTAAFEAYIAETRARAAHLTTHGVMRLAPPPTRVRPEPANVGTLTRGVPWTIEQADAARLPLGDAMIQVMVTSPPVWPGQGLRRLRRRSGLRAVPGARPDLGCRTVPREPAAGTSVRQCAAGHQPRRRTGPLRGLTGRAEEHRLDVSDVHRLAGGAARERWQIHRPWQHRFAVGATRDRPDRDDHRVLEGRVEPAPCGCVRPQPRRVVGLDQRGVDLRRRTACKSQPPSTLP